MDEYLLETPLGKLHIVCSTKGVRKIKFMKNDQNSNEINASSSCGKNQHMKLTIDWLKAYFEEATDHKMEVPSLDLDDHVRKKFSMNVWEVLKDRVGPGETISYGELATLCGSPKSARAVGQAMRTNPFTILVPCHRVIDAGGKLGNYSSGVDKKKWLLKHEGLEF